ncbi:MAG: hypothetical protein SV375_23255, partial [Thermodesulfobacteriota bacterium]|nr:hypothetical protein [Thermodesulfobacteriota bacterium]
MTENFEGYKVGVRTIMKANDLEARRDGRIIGLVADILQVAPEYEHAVETVLGDKLQYIIVERQKDGKEAVNYLKARAKGRSSFVPLKDLKEEKASNGNWNGFPFLRDLVSVPDSYRSLINALLDKTVLVEDLDQAIATWRTKGKDQCLVTPEGEMVDRKGIISGGKLSHGSHGILARKREIKELEVKTARCKDVVKKLNNDMERISFEIEEKETNLDDLMEEKADCQEKINNLDKTIFRLGHELDQLERLDERISGELEQKTKEQARHKEALSKIETELTVCKEKIKQEEGYLHEKEVELKESEEEFEQFRDELTGLRMDYNLAREEEKGLAREIERIDDFSDEAQNKIKTIKEDIVMGQQKYQECFMREEIVREELKEVYYSLEQAEEAVNRAERDRNQFYGQIREETIKVEELRGGLEVLREKINRGKLEQSEIEFKMNGLVDLIKEKFDLNLSQIYREYLEDDFSQLDTRERLEHQKTLKERLGEVNLTAIQEHEALMERHTFIVGQREDLLKSIDSLDKAIKKINKVSREK